MGLSAVLFGSNILIDCLRGVPQARQMLQENTSGHICPITWMEVMVGTTPETDRAARALLAFFRMLPLDQRIYEQAVTLRRKYRLKLPDALIYATARVYKLTLLTRNSKDFPDQAVIVPYCL